MDCIVHEVEKSRTQPSIFCLFVFKIFFLMWAIFKAFIEFVTILLLFHVLVFWLQGMCDLSSPTQD